MACMYKIRSANNADKDKIHSLVRESIASVKMISNPSLVSLDFMEEFVDKMICRGMLVVVENDLEEMEMIGEVHDYKYPDDNNEHSLKEFMFFSRLESTAIERETQIINWLYSEIQNKYKDAFRVKINTPVSSSLSVEYYKKMGLTVEANCNGRLKKQHGNQQLLLPLSWMYPS